MDIRLYQVNLDRDYAGVAFVSQSRLEEVQGTTEINSDVYDKVFEGEVNADNLEDVYRIFNTDHPEDYEGRSMSVSDVVEVVENGESSFHFCDSVGFCKVDFEPKLTENAINTPITVVMCEPGKEAKITTIGTKLEDLQKAVGGGLIETYYPFGDEPVCIVCNDEGKYNGMKPCRAIYDEGGEMMDIICGPFFICDCRSDRFESLNTEQLNRFRRKFKYPEQFLQVNDRIFAVPYKEEKHSSKDAR